MNKTSFFAVAFTATMLCSLISMLAKLNAAVEAVNASFPAML